MWIGAAFAITLAARAADGGIGAAIKVTPGEAYPDVAYALVGSPADRSGITAGDRLLAIDGVSLEGLTTEEATARIRGPVGTTARLTVLHQGLGHDVDVPRADTSALGARAAETMKTVCPAFRDILLARQDFAPLRGAELGDGWHASTVQVPGAAWTRIHRGLGERVFVSWGPAGSPAAAAARMDALLDELRPCFPLMWTSRERDARGQPTVLFGPASRAGWASTLGAFVVEGDEVRWYLSREDLDASNHYDALHGVMGPSSALWNALERVVASAAGGFSDVRRERREEGSPFNPVAVWTVGLALPGASGCEVRGDGASARYACRYAASGEDAVRARFDALRSELEGVLGGDWVTWGDGPPTYAGRAARHFARRTTRGYEKLPVVTLTATEGGVSVAVGMQGLL